MKKKWRWMGPAKREKKTWTFFLHSNSSVSYYMDIIMLVHFLHSILLFQPSPFLAGTNYFYISHSNVGGGGLCAFLLSVGLPFLLWIDFCACTCYQPEVHELSSEHESLFPMPNHSVLVWFLQQMPNIWSNWKWILRPFVTVSLLHIGLLSCEPSPILFEKKNLSHIIIYQRTAHRFIYGCDSRPICFKRALVLRVGGNWEANSGASVAWQETEVEDMKAEEKWKVVYGHDDGEFDSGILETDSFWTGIRMWESRALMASGNGQTKQFQLFFACAFLCHSFAVLLFMAHRHSMLAPPMIWCNWHHCGGTLPTSGMK